MAVPCTEEAPALPLTFLITHFISFSCFSKRKGTNQLRETVTEKRQGVTAFIFLLVVSVHLFCFCFFIFIFFLKRKKHNQGIYDSVRTVGERERSEECKANKKWVLNHMEQSTESCLGPHETTGPFGMRVWCLVS